MNALLGMAGAIAIAVVVFVISYVRGLMDIRQEAIRPTLLAGICPKCQKELLQTGQESKKVCWSEREMQEEDIPMPRGCGSGYTVVCHEVSVRRSTVLLVRTLECQSCGRNWTLEEYQSGDMPTKPQAPMAHAAASAWTSVRYYAVFALLVWLGWHLISFVFLPAHTPLHHAIQRGNQDEAQQLVAEGANVNARDYYGRTPLHLAASRWNEDEAYKLSQLLLKHGADVNARNKHGETSLHAAASGRHARLAILLLQRGADTEARDFGCTPLRMVFLGPSMSLSMTRDDMVDAERLVQALIHHGANVNARCDYTTMRDATALHFAVKNASLRIVRLLVDAGADMDARDRRGHTPYSTASHRKRGDIIAYLDSVRHAATRGSRATEVP